MKQYKHLARAKVQQILGPFHYYIQFSRTIVFWGENLSLSLSHFFHPYMSFDEQFLKCDQP